MSSMPQEKLERELIAQKKRAEAVAYLEKQGQSVDVPGQTKQHVQPTNVDNTLDLLFRQKFTSTASAAAIDRQKEQQAKVLLLKQQEDARAKRGDGAESSNTDIGTSSTSSRLPHGWQAVFDATSRKHYYWNTITSETSWVKPQSISISTSAEGGGGDVDDEQQPTKIAEQQTKSSSTSTGGKLELPPDWEEKVHPATGQAYYINSKTNERTFTRPGTAVSTTTIPSTTASTSRAQLQLSNGIGIPTALSSSDAGRKRGTEYGGGGGGGGAEGKKQRNREVDPLDPTAGKGGNRAGVNADKMADSTASGPLWQQRPYPAPGKILRAKPASQKQQSGPSYYGPSS